MRSVTPRRRGPPDPPGGHTCADASCHWQNDTACTCICSVQSDVLVDVLTTVLAPARSGAAGWSCAPPLTDSAEIAMPETSHPRGWPAAPRTGGRDLGSAEPARQAPPTSPRADLTCGRPLCGTSPTQAGERPGSPTTRERQWSSGSATGGQAN